MGGRRLTPPSVFSWRLNLPLFQFPTSQSVDAVFGHRSGVRENSIVKYVGWAVPETVYIDLEIIEGAPRALNIGGLGDVLCFFPRASAGDTPMRGESARNAGLMTKAWHRFPCPRPKPHWLNWTRLRRSTHKELKSWLMS
uniref:iron-containing alcohol dehydrogenase n=1 Tax=Ruegeria hyattellae TaxID=3233337 RepID=UPI00355B8AE0